MVVAPEGVTRDEGVNQRIARQGLERRPVEPPPAPRAEVLPGEVAARDALVVGAQGHGHARRAVEREGVITPAHAQDPLGAGGAHLHGDAPLGHLAQQGVGVALPRDVGAVPDAPRARHAHGVGDVKARVLGRDQHGRELPRVEAHGHARASLREVRHGAHVHVVVSPRHGVVLGGDEVQRHHPGVALHHLHRRGDLREDLLARQRANHLHDVAHDHPTPGVFVGLPAAQHLAHAGLLGVEPPPRGDHQRIETRLGEARAHRREVIAPPRGRAQTSRGPHAQGLHRLEVPGVLPREARDHLGEHVPAALAAGVESREGREELLVPRARPGDEVAQREPVDEGVVERRVAGQRVGRGEGSHRGVTRRLQHGRGRASHAEPVLHRPAQVRLGVHRPREVVVQVSALGHLAQKRRLLRALSLNRREVPRGARRGRVVERGGGRAGAREHPEQRDGVDVTAGAHPDTVGVMGPARPSHGLSRR